MATMADNHLSSIAKKGIGGDTELAHINKEEKQVLLAMGGSGTINPNTGLKQYAGGTLAAAAGLATTLNPYIAAAGLALTAASMFTGGKEKERAARAKIREAEAGIRELDRAGEAAGQALIAGRNQVDEEFRLGTTSIAGDTEAASKKAKASIDNVTENVDMSYSGTIQHQESEMTSDIQRKNRESTQGLIAKTGAKMGALIGEHEAEMSRIKAEKEKLQSVIDLNKKQEKSWYLGKYIGKAYEKTGTVGAASLSYVYGKDKGWF
tara:strand:- start:644 stop:1438 length:795 start_codon:yes stop_codon:yes gene_type:complete